MAIYATIFKRNACDVGAWTKGRFLISTGGEDDIIDAVRSDHKMIIFKDVSQDKIFAVNLDEIEELQIEYEEEG